MEPRRESYQSEGGEFAVVGRDREWGEARYPRNLDYRRSYEGVTPLEPHRGAPLNTRMLRCVWPKGRWAKYSRPAGKLEPLLSGTPKPPPGRYEGVISFVGNNYGFVERNDLKKFSFSSEAFWGDRVHMLPGVKVHFTVYKDKGKECATDIVVAPGGTEEVDTEIFQGVVITALGDQQVNIKQEKKLQPHCMGCIQANVFGNEMELPFFEEDSRVTLLPGDLVQFCMLTDLVTKGKRAVRISLLPDTFEFSKEIREMGIIMSITDDSGSIMSEHQKNLHFDKKENLDDVELKVMDEVEFTVISANSPSKNKAVRLKKLPKGTVTLQNKAKEKSAETKDTNKWKVGISEVLPQRTVVFEDVSSELYEGTVLKPIPKTSDKLQEDSSTSLYPGLLLTVLAGKDKELPFGVGDVLSEPSMLLGDKVQFNISTNRETKAERAINVEILPDTFQHTKEQRETGIVLDLRQSFGFIRCKQDPQMFFSFSEVMEESKLNVSDKVEFTVLPNTLHGLQAVRIKRLPESSFITARNLDGLTSACKDKQNITVKLMRDSVNEEVKNLKVKIESFNSDVPQHDNPSEVNYSADNKREPDLQSSKCGSALYLEETSTEIAGEQVVIDKSLSPRNVSRGNGHKTPEVESKSSSVNTEHSSSLSRSHSSHTEKHQSPSRKKDQRHNCSHSNSRDKVYKDNGSHSKDSGRCSRSRSRSRSRDPDYRYKGRHSHSCSSDRDYSGKGSRSTDQEYRDVGRDHEYRHKRSRSQDHGYKHSRSQSKEMIIQSSWRWNCSRSHSRERGSACSRKRSHSIDRSSNLVKKRRSPDQRRSPVIDSCLSPKNKSNRALQDPVTQELPKSGNSLDMELARKKRELELLEEQIAHKRAIIAMEQKGRVLSTQSEDEKCHINKQRLPEEPKNISPPEKRTSDPIPMKSVLKKCSAPFVDPDIQTEVCVHFFIISFYCIHKNDFNNKIKSNFFPPAYLSYSQCDLDQGSPHDAASDQASGHSYFEESCLNQVLAHESSSEDACINSHLRHSSANQRPISELPFCHIPLPRATSKDKSNLSTQIDRFLKTLNKGVDAKLLCSLVREAREATAHYESQPSCLLPEPELLCQEHKQYESIYERRPEQPGGHHESHEDFLVPCERVVQGNSDFSCIIGSTYTPQMQEHWTGGDVENEEQFLYGKKVQAEEHFSENLMSDEKLHRASLPPPVEGVDNTEKKHTFGRIQTLLTTVGLDLDMAEVSRLADRTQERLCGMKRKVSEQDHLYKDSECKVGRVDQQYSQQDPLHSEHTNSISSVLSSNQKVFISYPDKLESTGTQANITRTVHNIEAFQPVKNSVTVSLPAPSTSQYPQHLSDSVVEHSGYEDTDPKNGYSLQTGVALSSWDHVPLQTETQQYPAYSQRLDWSYLPSYGQLQPYVNASANPHAPLVFLHTNFSQMPLAAPMESYPRIIPTIADQSLDPFQSFSGPLLPSNYPQYPLAGSPIIYQPHDDSASATLQSLPSDNTQAPFFKETQTSKSRCLRVIQTVTLKHKKRKTSTALKEVTMHTLSSGSVPPSLENPLTVEKKQVARISEDDVKAKQKKRLEQFNERMRLKKEQLKAQRKCDKFQMSTTGKACKEVKNVWICGHSLVIWAEKRAKSPDYCMQLGMDPENVQLWWRGRQGLMWEQLLPLLLELKGNWPNPDVLIMHLGGNDLGQSDPMEFLDSVKKDLASMKSIFPQCLLVWSSILPRRSWKTSEDAEVMENIRVTVNENVGTEIRALGGMVVDHEQIRPGSDSGLYRPDGVHLTGKGIDTFNLNLQDFLVKWESETKQGSKSS
ncbi:uncharacterized protein LOC108918048 isoform X1 [Arapaima gigas]